MEAVIDKLKSEIIETMNLDMEVGDIDTDAPLFVAGLGLDSIDALELLVMLEKNYGISVTDPEEAKQIFVSVRTLAAYIEANKT
jgi:acyl carrier protein